MASEDRIRRFCLPGFWNSRLCKTGGPAQEACTQDLGLCRALCVKHTGTELSPVGSFPSHRPSQTDARLRFSRQTPGVQVKQRLLGNFTATWPLAPQQGRQLFRAPCLLPKTQPCSKKALRSNSQAQSMCSRCDSVLWDPACYITWTSEAAAQGSPPKSRHAGPGGISLVSPTKAKTLRLSPAHHPGSAQLRNSSPGLHRRLVFPKHLESRADQVLHSAATPSVMRGLFQLHSKANIRFPSSPGHRCWPKLQLPFSSRFHSSSGGNPAQLCPEGFSSHQFFPPKCQEAPNEAAGLSTRSTLSALVRTARELLPLGKVARPCPTEAQRGWGQSAGRGRIQDVYPGPRPPTLSTAH